jgi:hypothetical protein
MQISINEQLTANRYICIKDAFERVLNQCTFLAIKYTAFHIKIPFLELDYTGFNG